MQALVMQHIPHCSLNVMVLSLSHPIVLCFVGCFQLSSNGFFFTCTFKFIQHVVSSIISLESVHLFLISLSTSSLNSTNLKNVSSFFFMKKIQHFRENSSIKRTRYLCLEVEAAKKGPQTVDLFLSRNACALLSRSHNVDFVYFSKVHPLHTSCSSSAPLGRFVVIYCMIFKAS